SANESRNHRYPREEEMAKVYWVTCPSCGRKYYVSTSLHSQKVQLMCPFCKKLFDNPDAQS
ncbi:MAG: hypothetical protein Q7R39_03065, partial [Dehalococcoidia bacterium]|nr:hypothetical protein [Dehalococcoidia bacterium]